MQTDFGFSSDPTVAGRLPVSAIRPRTNTQQVLSGGRALPVFQPETLRCMARRSGEDIQGSCVRARIRIYDEPRIFGAGT